MSLNFFNTDCQEVLTENEFGLCDDQDGKKAYTNTDDKTKWIATVKNEANKSVVFTAIDKCVIKDNQEIGRGRCDGMLTSPESIYFVELKDQKSNWIPDAVKQLESTILFFKDNHDLNHYRHKKAFACSKPHPRFFAIDNEFNLRFYRTYGFRVDIQAEIIII